MQWMSTLTEDQSQAYIQHTVLVEETFKTSDAFTEEIEEDLMDDGDSDTISVADDYD